MTTGTSGASRGGFDCRVADICPLPTALCDPATGGCTVGCFSNSDCAYVADTPVCDLAMAPVGGTAANSGTCVQCLDPADCAAANLLACDPGTHRCSSICSTPADCTLTFAGCLNGSCGSCLTNADCPGTMTCSAGFCNCSTDAQCTSREASSCMVGLNGSNYCGCGAGCGADLVCDATAQACVPLASYPGGALCSISGMVTDPTVTTSNPCRFCNSAGDNSLCARNLNGIVCLSPTGGNPMCGCQTTADCPAGVCSTGNTCIASCVGGPACPAGTACSTDTGLCN